MKILRMSAKCSDLFSATLINEETGEGLGCYDGYVPEWFPNGGDDYVNFDINIETGVIVNWHKPNKSQLKKTFSD